MNRLIEMIDRQAASMADREAYRFCWRKNGEWLSTSWAEFKTQVDVASRALAALGLGELDRIAVCSPNTPQILIAEFGAFRNRASAIPLYSNSSQDQFDFIVSDGGARILFVGDKNQYPLALDYARRHPEILKIVIFKNDGMELEEGDDRSIFWDDFVRLGMEAGDDIRRLVDGRAERGVPEDMATLIYTSGTTGEPKGVVITHANYDATLDAHLRMLTALKDTDVSMAFLPMSHILEKAWCYFCLTRGIVIAVNYDPRVITETIHDVHPNVMCCVPRFWEKVYAAVKEKIAGMSPLQRLLVSRALACGRKRNLKYKRLNLPVPYLLEKEYNFWDRRVFQLLKNAVGIPDPNFFPTAGAPLSVKILEFMRSVGIDVIIGYGLSETTATVTCFRTTGYEVGSVGTPLPSVEVKIGENDEILVKGASVTPGYYNNEEANRKAFTEDGFFRTGDAGYFDDSGALFLTERIKDLFKTSNGKYIAPQVLESRLAENKYIEMAAVIGDRRKFVTALIVPSIPKLRKWAEAHGIPSSDSASLCKNPRVVSFIMSQVDSVQRNLASWERIKRITLIPQPFSIMHGEVTNTMKVRRPVVARRYAKEIDAMYDETGA